MLDTLKLTKRLEGAGVERPVAEAMAEAFAESTAETVATKDDLRHEAATLRTETQTLGSELRTEMARSLALRAEMERWARAAHRDGGARLGAADRDGGAGLGTRGPR